MRPALTKFYSNFHNKKIPPIHPINKHFNAIAQPPREKVVCSFRTRGNSAGALVIRKRIKIKCAGADEYGGGSRTATGDINTSAAATNEIRRRRTSISSRVTK